ncbi:MAG: NapC/NirT family cytochrome c [Clostridiales bacterium]|nr:NapC/NirT family cytochrome c [Clostridiales bacterium]
MKRPDITGAWNRARRHRGAMIAISLVGAMLVIVLATAALLEGAARTPALAGVCGSCHEIAPHVAAWRASSHANTGCRSCHTEYAWHDGFRYRATDFADEVSQYLSGDAAQAAQPERRGAVGPIAETPDNVCLRCHSMTREPSTGDRVIIDHADHAERNDACLSCHLNTTHPDPETDIVLVMMEQCYECHSLTPAPGEPSGECAVCHPAHLELTPASHDPIGEWQRPAHGDSAKTDTTQCMMCHTEQYCVDCHGVLMPHPPTFAQDHGVEAASLDRVVCSGCHYAAPDPCSACHHSLEGAVIDTWGTQHYRVTRIQGPAACMRCHEAVFCAQCHGRGSTPQ